ncbi:hypothetical protein [Agromyces subbeticus]|uniref:hypothetical protein n=1 Tax=Agromyces subbeticus TaxID=293890 RepID=UPI0003B61B95|nr:hypothetical protein [Agromyces subbeticus]
MSTVEEYATPAPDADRGGFLRVLVATGVIGIAGYVITWLVPWTIGAAAYSTFAVFWSFTFLLAAGLSGIQQEITRATHVIEQPVAPPATELSQVTRFAVVATVIVAVVLLVSAPFWGSLVFPDLGLALVWPLVVGACSYVLLAVLTGTLYGVSHWTALFWAILVEGVLRLALIAIVLFFTHDVVALAWAVAAPFPTTFVIIWLVYRRRLAGRTRLDVGYRALTWNVARTILAAISMGMLVSGFPLLLEITTPASGGAALGVLILLTVLVRAPLIVVGMALQSYFVVLFRNSADRFWATVLRLELLVLVAGIVVTALGWWLGPAVFAFLFPQEAVPSATLIAALAASSALLGGLCVMAPATLARSHHTLFTVGWVLAAVVTIAVLLLPLDLETRAVASLIGGPAAGLLVQSVGLPLAERRR